MDKAARERIKQKAAEIKSQRAMDDLLAEAKGHMVDTSAHLFPPVQAETQETGATPVKKEKKPPRDPNERVRYSCGHHEPIAVLMQHPCQACTSRNRIAKAKRNRANWEAKRKVVIEQGGRLPDGAYFTMEPYRADTQTWHVELVIPGGPLFMKEGTALFRVMQDLDAEFRKWLLLPREDVG
jgi:hypothetical protein